MPKVREPLKGTCEFFVETGTEGGYWAFQEPKKKGYDGLHILRNGDQLTIYDKFDLKKIVWKGTVNLIQYPCFTQDVWGFWIHADQEGVAREKWATWFFGNFPATLIPAE